MKKRILALFCAISVLAMNVGCPVLAEEETPAPVEQSAPAEAPEPPAPAPAPAEQSQPEPAPAEEAPAPAEEAPAEAPPAATEAPVTTPETQEAPEPEAPTEAPEAEPQPTDPGEAPESPEPTEESEPAPAETPEAPEPVEETPQPVETPEDATPLALRDLKVNKSSGKVGATFTWRFVAEGAEQVTYTIASESGETVASGTAAEGRFSWKATFPGVYTATVTASAHGESRALTSAVTIKAERLILTIKPSQLYGVVNSKAIRFKVRVKGGIEPYAIHYEILQGRRNLVAEGDMGDESVSYMPVAFGDHTIRVTVTDAMGTVVTENLVIAVAVREQESWGRWERTLPRLNDDMSYAERLVAVARSQVGYHESDRDFIVNDDGEKNGYTRYGHMYGMPYEEWCAMFVHFCLHYAGVPTAAVPGESNCFRWKQLLGSRYLDDEDKYRPKAGDLIFFHHDRDGNYDPNFPNHVGIVVGLEGATVRTIEGNSGRAVRERSYELDDKSIVGYVDLGAALEAAEAGESPANDDEAEPLQGSAQDDENASESADDGLMEEILLPSVIPEYALLEAQEAPVEDAEENAPRPFKFGAPLALPNDEEPSADETPTAEADKEAAPRRRAPIKAGSFRPMDRDAAVKDGSAAKSSLFEGLKDFLGMD